MPAFIQKKFESVYYVLPPFYYKHIITLFFLFYGKGHGSNESITCCIKAKSENIKKAFYIPFKNICEFAFCVTVVCVYCEAEDPCCTL